MKDWIMELCPEIAEWQADLIAEQAQREVAAEREACAQVCDEAAHDWHQHAKGGPVAVYNACAAAIRARGQA